MSTSGTLAACVFYLLVCLSPSIWTDVGLTDGRAVNSFARPKQKSKTNSWVTSVEASLNTPAIRTAQNDACAVANRGKQPCLTLLWLCHSGNNNISNNRTEFYRLLSVWGQLRTVLSYNFRVTNALLCDILLVSWSSTPCFASLTSLKLVLQCYGVLISSQEKSTQTNSIFFKALSPVFSFVGMMFVPIKRQIRKSKDWGFTTEITQHPPAGNTHIIHTCFIFWYIYIYMHRTSVYIKIDTYIR